MVKHNKYVHIAIRPLLTTGVRTKQPSLQDGLRLEVLSYHLCHGLGFGTHTVSAHHFELPTCEKRIMSYALIKVVNEDGDAFKGFFACLLDVHGELDLCLYSAAQVDDAVEGGGE